MLLNSLIGQNYAVELLQQAIARQRLAPAYLFVGPEGVGRRQAALGWAELLLSQGLEPDKQALCQKQVLSLNHPDLLLVQPTYLHQGKLLTAVEAEAAGVSRKSPPQVRIEQIRAVAEFLSRPPIFSQRSLVIIEQAETMAEAAANALLKTLEEPGRATLILISPSREVLLPTIISRCQSIPFYRLSEADLKTVLTQAGHEEILNHPTILQLAQGSPGQAIAFFEQLNSLPQELISRLSTPVKTPLDAFTLSQEIVSFDLETQLWLVTYLQSVYWYRKLSPAIAHLWEKAHQMLLNYVNPRLVWDCTLVAIAAQDDKP